MTVSVLPSICRPFLSMIMQSLSSLVMGQPNIAASPNRAFLQFPVPVKAVDPVTEPVNFPCDRHSTATESPWPRDPAESSSPGSL